MPESTSYLEMILSRAWEETWSLVSGSPILSVVIGFAIFGLTLFLSKKFIGKEAAYDDAKSAGLALLATLIIGILVFLINIFWLVPKSVITENQTELTKAAQNQYEQTQTVSDLQEQIEALRLDVDAAKKAQRVEIAQAPIPLIQGVSVACKQIPSPRREYPYAIRAYVQFQQEISPFAIAFVCDKKIELGTTWIAPGDQLVNEASGTATTIENPDHSFVAKINSPALGPEHSLTVTLFSNEPFSVIKVDQIHLDGTYPS